MRADRLAWGLWGLAALLVVPGPVLQTALEWRDETDLPFLFAFIAMQLLTATAGAVIAARLPRNPVGWSFLAMGVGLAIGLSSSAYAELGLHSRHGPFPLDEVVAWVSNWIFLPVMFGIPMFLLFVFPTGRFLSPRWRAAATVILAVVGVAIVALALKPGELGGIEIENPLALHGSAGELMTTLDTITNILALPAFIVGVSALVVRLRRSRGVERQQLKWFTFIAAFVPIGLGGSVMVPGWPADVLFLVGLLALAGLPVAAVIAILRYRLYDIDLVIRRTLVYGALTATLIASYLGAVVLLQLALGPLTEDNDLAIAGSTLAAAALVRPARARIQAIVDRRFYRRSRYDASQTVESFGARLRDEVELDAVVGDLRGVVADTMQPAHVSLWLRRPA